MSRHLTKFYLINRIDITVFGILISQLSICTRSVIIREFTSIIHINLYFIISFIIVYLNNWFNNNDIILKNSVLHDLIFTCNARVSKLV